MKIISNYIKEFSEMSREEKMQVILFAGLLFILLISIISNIYIRSKIKQSRKDFKDKYQ